jgi:hypothetical protein
MYSNFSGLFINISILPSKTLQSRITLFQTANLCLQKIASIITCDLFVYPQMACHGFKLQFASSDAAALLRFLPIPQPHYTVAIYNVRI